MHKTHRQKCPAWKSQSHANPGLRSIISEEVSSAESEQDVGTQATETDCMYANHFGLTESPFYNSGDARWYYESPGHEEALARLLFLVEEGRRCGLLTGRSGTGKSLLLQILDVQSRRAQREIAFIDLAGQSAQGMLWETAAALGLAPSLHESGPRLSRALKDFWEASDLTRSRLILLFDHVDQAEPECLAAIERMLHFSGGASRATIVLAARSEQLGRTRRSLTQLADLHIDLPPLDLDQTRHYVESLLGAAGASQEIFERPALERLFEASRGVPREINRLCDLSLISAMSADETTVSEQIVASSAEELNLTPRAPRRTARRRKSMAFEL
jgi:general secretion pathway protein A